MENNGITCVVCSRQTNNEKKDFLDNLVKTCNYRLNIQYIVNDGSASLTTVYNEAIKKSKDDIVVFVHDDIEFLKEGWGAEIVRLFNEYKEYGIIGVAGSAVFDEKCAWWGYKEVYGQVLHRHDGRSWLTAFSPLLDNDLQEVCVIDGLFMAVHKKRISETFDTDFAGFNHYDTSFCISNFINGKCKIGVTTNIRLAHDSIGETKENWFNNKELLLNKYGKYFPLKVKCK